MKHNFEERKQNRIDHAKTQAQKNEKLSEQLSERASKMSSAIPMGQPILVGHHSEKRDRNYRAKIHNTFGQSVKAGEKATYYEDKAVSIENNTAIFSDDPNAILKLNEKLTKLEDKQSFMKLANKCIKAGKKEKFLDHPLASEKLWNELNTPDCAGRLGFARFELTNNNAEINRLKKRIVQLQAVEAIPETDKEVNGVRLFANKEANRVQLFFPNIPSEEIRKKMKKNGFIWCSSEVAWQRHLSPMAVNLAERLLRSF